MNIKKALIPDHWKEMMDQNQREALGITTEEEREKQIEVYNERKLHEDLRQLLNLKGIVFFEQRMDKRSRGPKGWPDFTFSVGGQRIILGNAGPPEVFSCAWEAKAGKGELRPEQKEMLQKLQTPPNAWRVVIIRSLQQACDELKALGI